MNHSYRRSMADTFHLRTSEQIMRPLLSYRHLHRAFITRVIKDIFIKIEVSRPAILFRNVGEPQAKIFFSIPTLNLGFMNFKSALPLTNGVIAIN